MFSNNQKISGRQLKRLLILDFFGKGAVLLPEIAGSMKGREFVLGLMLVTAAMLLFAWAVVRVSKNVRGDFYEYLKERLGKGTAFVLGLFFLAYAFWNLVYLTCVFETLGRNFVLLESRGEPLMLLFLLLAAYLALGGLEVRGRVAETLYPILFYPILFLLVYSAFHVRPDYISAGELEELQLSGKSLLGMFGVFGGSPGFLFIAPKVEEKGGFLRGLAWAGGTLLVLFVILAGAFGENGISGLPWPAVTLMSSAEIPGDFLERWDVIFTGLLMGELIVSAGAALSYIILFTGNLFPGRNRRACAFLGCLLALGGVFWCGGQERAVEVYTIVNCYGTVPVGVALVLLLLWMEKIKRRREA